MIVMYLDNKLNDTLNINSTLNNDIRPLWCQLTYKQSNISSVVVLVLGQKIHQVGVLGRHMYLDDNKSKPPS